MNKWDKDFIEKGGCIVKFNKKDLTMGKVTISGESVVQLMSSEILQNTAEILKKNKKYKVR